MNFKTLIHERIQSCKSICGMTQGLVNQGWRGRPLVIQATTPAHFDAIRSIRFEIYHQEKKILGVDELFDDYDSVSTHWLVICDGEPAACVRITDAAQVPLELLKHHPELSAALPAGLHCIELSRFLARKKYRGYRVTFNLFKKAHDEMTRLGADAVIISCPRPMIAYYQRLLGFRLLTNERLKHYLFKDLYHYAMIFRKDGWIDLSPAGKFTWAMILGPFKFLLKNLKFERREGV